MSSFIVEIRIFCWILIDDGKDFQEVGGFSMIDFQKVEFLEDKVFEIGLGFLKDRVFR